MFDFSTTQWNSFWHAVYRYFEAENNVKLLPESLYEKLSSCILEDFHNRVSQGNYLQRLPIPDYTSKLRHIESLINSFQSVSNIVCFNKFTDDSLAQVSFLTYLVETILNVLNIDNKMFVIFLMNKKIYEN